MTIAYYDVIRSVDFYIIFEWVFYVVHKVCWANGEVCV